MSPPPGCEWLKVLYNLWKAPWINVLYTVRDFFFAFFKLMYIPNIYIPFLLDLDLFNKRYQLHDLKEDFQSQNLCRMPIDVFLDSLRTDVYLYVLSYQTSDQMGFFMKYVADKNPNQLAEQTPSEAQYRHNLLNAFYKRFYKDVVKFASERTNHKNMAELVDSLSKVDVEHFGDNEVLLECIECLARTLHNCVNNYLTEKITGHL